MHGTWKLALMSAAVVSLGACKAKDDGMGRSDQMAGGQMAMAGTEYTVILKSSWTAATHPFEYPTVTTLHAPHFSGLIGTAHNASYAIFTEGALPTPGLEHLSEEGKHSPLNDEINAAVAAHNALALFETDPLRNFADSLVVTIRVDSAHPMVSLVAMIAPSPDWFAGVRDVNLMENGAWVASRTVDLRPYDSGGDDGTTYKAADLDNNPKKPTTLNASRHFTVNGVASAPVGTVTFIKR